MRRWRRKATERSPICTTWLSPRPGPSSPTAVLWSAPSRWTSRTRRSSGTPMAGSSVSVVSTLTANQPCYHVNYTHIYERDSRYCQTGVLKIANIVWKLTHFDILMSMSKTWGHIQLNAKKLYLGTNVNFVQVYLSQNVWSYGTFVAREQVYLATIVIPTCEFECSVKLLFWGLP